MPGQPVAAAGGRDGHVSTVGHHRLGQTGRHPPGEERMALGGGGPTRTAPEATTVPYQRGGSAPVSQVHHADRLGGVHPVGLSPAAPATDHAGDGHHGHHQPLGQVLHHLEHFGASQVQADGHSVEWGPRATSLDGSLGHDQSMRSRGLSGGCSATPPSCPHRGTPSPGSAKRAFSFPLRNLWVPVVGVEAAPVLGVAQLQEEPHDCRTDPAARVLRAADHH